MSVEFLHAMVRVGDLPAALRFFCDGLGLREIRRNDYPEGRYTLVFLASPDDLARSGWDGAGRFPAGLPMVELTHNWDEKDYAADAISAISLIGSTISTPSANVSRSLA